jgi:hypothetical protein
MKSPWQVLLHAAQVEDGEILSCEECVILLDYLSELLAGGVPPDEVRPVAHRHLAHCPACTRELEEALLEWNITA